METVLQGGGTQFKVEGPIIGHPRQLMGARPAEGPPLDPAGVLSRSYGFRTAPATELRDSVGENAHSPMLPFPSSTAPAPFNLATCTPTLISCCLHDV